MALVDIWAACFDPMTAEQRILNVESQMKACEEGRTNIITCPYCGTANKEPADDSPGTLCCETLSITVLAILDRWVHEAQREQFERIAEKVSLN